MRVLVRTNDLTYRLVCSIVIERTRLVPYWLSLTVALFPLTNFNRSRTANRISRVLTRREPEGNAMHVSIHPKNRWKEGHAAASDDNLRDARDRGHASTRDSDSFYVHSRDSSYDSLSRAIATIVSHRESRLIMSQFHDMQIRASGGAGWYVAIHPGEHVELPLTILCLSLNVIEKLHVRFKC